MREFPSSEHLPIGKLAASFNNTTATYKFFWLLSILEQVEKGKTLIAKKELFAGMVSQAWYTVNYFHVSFGEHDLLEEHIIAVKEIEQISISASKEEIRTQLIGSLNPATHSLLLHFDRHVPHRFLSPWFPGAEKNEVYVRSNDPKEISIYALERDFISLNLLWANYLIVNAALIRDFCYWRLALYLQARNPNVPDIPNKLIKPAQRNALTKQRMYWDQVISDMGPISCIYTQEQLEQGRYEVEHFIPYSFVSHDLLWNLIPANPSFNRVKSDKLPRLEMYFDAFFDLQMKSLILMKEKQPRNPLLDDYLTIFPDLDASITREKYYKHLQPLITIAANNRFEYLTL
ncbi:MAG: hypothetical protein FJX80_04825 [Bacteroidetes bacterium]|nr:hypothetical protein [Bacteroidota bacterium]